MTWHMYILRCEDESLYVGHTHDLERRVTRHRAGSGAHHTATRQVKGLAYSEAFTSHADAIKRERQIKKWTRAKKEALINGRIDDLRQLSKSKASR